MKSELEQFISNNREALDTRTPDPAVLEKLLQQMEGKTVKKKERTIVVSMKMARWAAACLLLLAGATVFLVLQKGPATDTAATVKTNKLEPVIPTDNKTPEETATVENKTVAEQPARNNIYAAEQDLNARKQVLFAKLNNMESPSQRLIATEQAGRIKSNSNDIVDALVKTMNADPSTNVRLAALDALAKFYRESYVKKQLIASLKKQKDPMVQIGLIELLTKMKESSILTELDKIVNDGNTMDAVKDHAYSSIFTLRS